MTAVYLIVNTADGKLTVSLHEVLDRGSLGLPPPLATQTVLNENLARLSMAAMTEKYGPIHGGEGQ